MLAGGTAPHPVPGSLTSLAGGFEIYRSPVQQGKVQPPLLPEETLRRDRLLDWLHVRIHSRLVLVVAEAGYGKTTLLADFTRRTRVRCLWYRLDEGDRDRAVLLSHLVAAGRELDPSFAPITESLLRELAAGGGDLEAALNSFTAEFGAWVTGPTALILDDYHLVDGAAEVRETVRRLLARGADRLAIVIATRRPPALPLARLRAQGEVAELGTDDLRFDRAETELLFRETYRQPLEPDVLAELARYTEGWAATLRLAHAAMRGQGAHEIRRIVRELSGHHGDVHDYLAEEVIGGLPADLRAFVQRCALLAAVTPRLAAAAALVDEGAARAQMDALEVHGLLSRRGRGAAAARLFHPLVRDFLVHRLTDELGEEGTVEVHLRIARAAEPDDWAVAADHYAAAGRPTDVARVLEAAMPAIFGSGAYAQAEDLARDLPAELTEPWLDVVHATHEVKQGQVQTGQDLARAVWDRVSLDAGSTVAPYALTVLVSAAVGSGDFGAVAALSNEIVRRTADPSLRAMAAATTAVVRSAGAGSLDDAERALLGCVQTQARMGRAHYQGIALLNLGWVQRAMGKVQEAEASARSALDLLVATSLGPEVTSARIVLAWALAHQGRLDDATSEMQTAIRAARPDVMAEVLTEAADIYSAYLDPNLAEQLLTEAGRVGSPSSSVVTYGALVGSETKIRLGEFDAAASLLSSIRTGEHEGYPALGLKVMQARCMLAALTGRREAQEDASALIAAAERQSAHSFARAGRVMLALARETASYGSSEVAAVLTSDPALISTIAEIVVASLTGLNDDARVRLVAEISQRPARWLPSLRRHATDGPYRERLGAAHIIELVGERSDVGLLRAIARDLRSDLREPALGRALARRVADRVFVEDQGRVVLYVGSRAIPGTELRRKVLALLCFLITQPGLAAARDHAMEALWPDADPEQALNSLHQTTYFLRRTIEPDYVEDLSPGYLHHEGDVVWLDPELVDSRSRRCAGLLKALGPTPSPDDIDRLAAEYRGRFALDFAYEDWASSYRDTLHARYLEAMERSLAQEVDAGHLERATRIAQRTLEVDPDAEQMEVALLRLYRATGAHAAAAEQYAHYATVMREQLGVEPPPLEEL